MARWLCTGGTRLATPHGPIAVEHVLPGMVLLARDGAALIAGPVGRIRLSVAELLTRPALWPVRVAAGVLQEGVLGDGLPAHDVLVLADQPLAVRGAAPIAAAWLVDGTALDRPPPVAPLDVYSLTLDGAGIPAGMVMGMVMADGAGPPRPVDAALRVVRQDLAAAAGIAAGPLLGSVDGVEADRLEGWADDGSGRPVALELVIDGVVAPPVPAGRLRSDLAAAGIGDGRRGFVIPLDPPLDRRRRHLLRLRRALDGAELPGSPILLDSVAELAAVLDGLPDEPVRRQAVEAAARAVAARLAARPLPGA